MAEGDPILVAMPPLFGSKKKGTPAATEQVPPDPSAQEPLEFSEVAGAPAAASPPQTETVPAAVGAARALRAVRSRPQPRSTLVTRSRPPVVSRPPRKAPTPTKRKAKATAKRTPVRQAAAGKRPLTAKQLAQRKYAARMRTVRKRATATAGGKGRIAKRSPATRLRRELGLKPGKAAAKGRGGPGRRKR
jgi:hypothetical protein